MAFYRKRIDNLIARIEKALVKWERISITEYEEYRHNKKSVLFFNFLIGVFRGVGFVIGATVVGAIVLALLTWVLSKSINMPVIGEFIAKIVDYVRLYSQGAPP